MSSVEAPVIMIMPQVLSLTNTESSMDISARIGNHSKSLIISIYIKEYRQKMDMCGNRGSKYLLHQHKAGTIVISVTPMSENSRQGGKVKNITI